MAWKKALCRIIGIVVLFIALSGCTVAPPENTGEQKSPAVPAANFTVSYTPVETTYDPPDIKVISIPNRAVENTNFTIKWEVSGGTKGDISKTYILWDFKSSNATALNYSHITSSIQGSTPGNFSEMLKIPGTSTIYFRVFAIVDGIEIFSDENRITIYPEYTKGY